MCPRTAATEGWLSDCMPPLRYPLMTYGFPSFVSLCAKAKHKEATAPPLADSPYCSMQTP